jgi:hypothetical protein
MIDKNNDLLAAYRFVDGRRFFYLSDEQIRAIWCATKELPSEAVGALVPEGYDLAHFASPPQPVLPAFSITADDLDRFLHDPAPRNHLIRGVPVLVVFEARADYWRLGSIVPALPLSNDEEARLDHDEQARLDEADEARCDHDDQAPLDDADDARLDDDDEPTWNYRE